MKHLLLCAISVCLFSFHVSANVSDEWTEDTPQDIAVPAPLAMVESPLSLHSKSTAGHFLAFDQQKYDTLKKQVVDGLEIKIPNFIQAAASTEQLHLVVYSVFAEDATIVQVNADGETALPRPDVVHLQGTVDGNPDTFVQLNLSPHGTTGYVHTAEERYGVEALSEHQAHSVINSGADAISEEDQKAIETLGITGSVEADLMSAGFAGQGESDYAKVQFLDRDDEQLMLTQEESAGKNDLWLALDIDYQGVALLDRSSDSQTELYLANLVAGASVIYARDLKRNLKIKRLQKWTEEAGAAKNINSGTASLGPYRDLYKTEYYGTFQYDVAHLFTGIREGGVAYVGTVCSGNGGYNTGVSSLQGTWQGEQISSRYNWDLIVTTHELGHNMGSGHSHDYNPPIDECVACDEPSASGSCGGSAARPVARTDERCVLGTIMSYCHLCGGTQNVAMKMHQRSAQKMITNLNQRCGTSTLGEAPVSTPTEAPVTAPTEAPVSTPTKAPTAPVSQDGACTNKWPARARKAKSQAQAERFCLQKAKKTTKNPNGQCNRAWVKEACQKSCKIGAACAEAGTTDDSAPKAAPTPAPGATDSGNSCTAKNTLGKCEQCLSNDQCSGNNQHDGNKGTWYCCPYMKKCVETSSMGCYYPIANCRGWGASATCEKDLDTWAKRTCE